MRELSDGLDEWALAIGRFLVAFSSCEYWTYQFIRTYGSENLRESISDLQLKARAAIAHALVTDIGLTSEAQKRVDQAFAELSRLAKPRNLVAHNCPLVQLYKDERGEIFVRHELRSARDELKDITIERLAALTVESRDLDQELALLYGLIRQPANHRCE
ncbi:hypothetical protein [Rhodoferax sp.]|uniref:hypothetical protein n=1 Tax=Rhodoferax sp. TaxID=50421 RepID=UPI003017B46D